MTSVVLNTPPTPFLNQWRPASERWVEVVTHLDPKYGGLSAAVPALGRSLAASEHIDVSLAAFCAAGEQVEPANFAASQLSFWPASRKPWLTDVVHSNRLHKNFVAHLRGASGLHIHGLWEQSTSAGVSAARELGVPYVLSAHGMLEPWALASKGLKKMLYAMLVERGNVGGAACLHALTKAEANQYRAFGSRCPIAIIPNGVDIPEDLDASLFVQSFPAVKGKRIVLFLARLHPKKGLDLLLEAWALLAPIFPDAHLVIAGPDSEGMQDRLAGLVARDGLKDSVLFTGMLGGPMKWSALAAAEAFVLPSKSEGLSVSILEAMGVGLPVVVTTACNLPEVEQYQAGWQIEPTLDHLTSALAELLHNSPVENSGVGARGAALVRARYTWPTVARQMADVYRWVAGGPPPRDVTLVFPECA